jgi:hypothetical protein
MPEIDRGLDEIFRVAAAFEKGKSTPAAELDIVLGGRHALLSSYFRH